LLPNGTVPFQSVIWLGPQILQIDFMTAPSTGGGVATRFHVLTPTGRITPFNFVQAGARRIRLNFSVPIPASARLRITEPPHVLRFGDQTLLVPQIWDYTP